MNIWRIALASLLVGGAVWCWRQHFAHRPESLLDHSHCQAVAKLYDDLIDDIKTAGNVAHFHSGFVFDWDTQGAFDLQLQQGVSGLDIMTGFQNHRDYFGFLFLNNPGKHSKILDAGCGVGTTTVLLANRFDCCVDGVSLSHKELELAHDLAQQKAVSSSKINFIQADMLHLPMQNSTYDAIWASESTEYVADLQSFFQEIKRIAKPYARMVIFAWCYKNHDAKKQIDDEFMTHLHSFDQYIAAARLEGMKLIHHQNVSSWVAAYGKFQNSGVVTISSRLPDQLLKQGKLSYHLICFDIVKT